MSRIQSRRLSLSSGSWIGLLSGSRFRGRRKFAGRRSRGWLMSRYSPFYDPPTRGSRHPWNLRGSAFALHEFVPCRWKSLSREPELACNRRPTRLEDVASWRRTRLCATGVAAFRPPFRGPSPDCQLLHDRRTIFTGFVDCAYKLEKIWFFAHRGIHCSKITIITISCHYSLHV